jgi:hypothetical protein
MNFELLSWIYLFIYEKCENGWESEMSSEDKIDEVEDNC